MKINYLIGDATYPIGDDMKIIAHICNNKNSWGAGFVVAVSKRWGLPEIKYRSMGNKHILGSVQYIKVEKDITVANMIAQNGFKSKDIQRPLSYEALYECLKDLNITAITLGATIHMPKIGTGIAGGDWDIIQDIIESTLTRDVYVYTLPNILLTSSI